MSWKSRSLLSLTQSLPISKPTVELLQFSLSRPLSEKENNGYAAIDFDAPSRADRLFAER